MLTLFSAPSLVAQAVERTGLDEVLQIARERNPRLKALGAAAEAAACREPEASTLPDPTFQFGVMNFGVPSFNTDMAMSMAPSVQLMQMVPFPGKLGLKGEIAGFGHDMAEATADEAWWQVRSTASGLFYDLYSLDMRTRIAVTSSMTCATSSSKAAAFRMCLFPSSLPSRGVRTLKFSAPRASITPTRPSLIRPVAALEQEAVVGLPAARIEWVST